MRTEPNYYKDFKCMANGCNDNCCIGWEIDIDEKSYEDYINTGGEFGNRLKSGIVEVDNIHCFRLDSNERCVFLNENNLCDIIINMGEEHLCEICHKHPRFINRYAHIEEYGLGLACEEAGRIILSQEQQFNIVECKTKSRIKNPFTETDFYLAYLYEIRNIIFEILQFNKYDIPQKLLCVLQLCLTVENECSSSKTDEQLFCEVQSLKKFNILKDEIKTNACDIKIKPFLIEVLKSYLENEILCDSWKIELEDILKRIGELSEDCILNLHKKFLEAVDTEKVLENLLVYLAFRYFLECYYDEAIYEKIMLMFSAYMIIQILFHNHFIKTGKCDFEDMVEIIHNYSKETEYSDINIEKLNERLNESSFYDIENICAFLEFINSLK